MYEELKNKLEKNIKCELTDEEIKMLYGIDYDTDYSLYKYIEDRKNQYNDLIRVFDKKEIATSVDQIDVNTIIYIGELNAKNNMPCYNLRYIYGDLLLSEKDVMFDNLEKIIGSIYYSIFEKEDFNFDNLDYHFGIDKEYALSIVSKRGYELEYLSDELKNDRDVVLAAVKQNGYALRFASIALRKNREIILEAVKQEGEALKFAIGSNVDREIVLTAVKQNAFALQHVNEELIDDELVQEAIKHDGMALLATPYRYREDKKIVLLAVKNNGLALQYALGNLNNDRDVVLEAVKQNGAALKYAYVNLQDDDEIVNEALNNNPTAVCWASDRFKKNRNLVLAAVKQTPYVLDQLEEYITDKEIVLEALKTDLSYLVFVDFTNDKDFILELIKIFANHEGVFDNYLSALQYASDDLKHDSEIINKSLESMPSSYCDVPEEIREDRDFNISAVQLNGLVLEYLPAKLQVDREIVLEAVKQNGLALSFVNSIYGDDDEIANEAVKQNPEAIEYVSDRIKESISNNKVK